MRDPGQHPTVRCVELEGHAVHGHDRDFPAREAIEGIEQVLSEPPPPGKLADQNGVYLPGLREIEDLIAGARLAEAPEAVALNKPTTS
ncbi:hypothetical protein GCM10011363_39740 [Marivita lacus]|uniref:Uncharacterized protein n=1 Tax=Marivita lacus TaxID=1323742 RepID=A0ABQ1L8S9_9RHOB|nr:hypothetical protein GCM10011363_39740 [Marivita lacus]